MKRRNVVDHGHIRAFNSCYSTVHHHLARTKTGVRRRSIRIQFGARLPSLPYNPRYDCLVWRKRPSYTNEELLQAHPPVRQKEASGTRNDEIPKSELDFVSCVSLAPRLFLEQGHKPQHSSFGNPLQDCWFLTPPPVTRGAIGNWKFPRLP